MTAFGILALSLAVVGVYAIAAYSVQQRTQEIGVRLALGASPRRVQNMVLRNNVPAVLAGVILGVASAVGLGRILKGFLFGVTAYDPFTFTLVPVILVFAALVGIWLPARRAGRVDPLITLRSE
jgi:ABC-type antimicrobial peptide transport system permease subunit